MQYRGANRGLAALHAVEGDEGEPTLPGRVDLVVHMLCLDDLANGREQIHKLVVRCFKAQVCHEELWLLLARRGREVRLDKNSGSGVKLSDKERDNSSSANLTHGDDSRTHHRGMVRHECRNQRRQSERAKNPHFW